MTIWKFPLEICDEQTIHPPKEFEILSIQVQHGIPCLWAIVDPDRPLDSVKILTIGTGHPMKTVGKHLGTYQLSSFVFHVFLSWTPE